MTPNGVEKDVRVAVRNGKIAQVLAGARPEQEDLRYADDTLLPGLVDLQVNGGAGAGYDALEGEERARATAHHLARGTTSLLATLVSAPLNHLEEALERLASDVCEDGPVVGIHLEGPFLAREKSGAHARECLCHPSAAAVDALIARAGTALRMVTLAPELPGALDAVARFRRAGAVVAAGHTLATSEQLRRAIDRGLEFVTHVGNASEWPSRPFDPELRFRRSEPGVIGTFLFEERLSGSLILDGLHLHPELAGAIARLRGPDRVVLVSDAAPAAGLPPGRFHLGRLEAEITSVGYATTGEGLAGSAITLIDALRVAVEQASLPLEVAARMASATPARIAGIAERKGSLRRGADADLLLLGPDFRPSAVYRLGRRV